MSKRHSRRQKKRQRTAARSRRKVLLIVGLILVLSLAGGILAQWRAARMRALLLSPAPPIPPAGSPSKEYIYAGGRLLATEEQAQGTSPSPTALAANATSTTQVSLSWTAPATGAVDHYQVERAQTAGSFAPLNGNPTTTSFND